MKPIEVYKEFIKNQVENDNIVEIYRDMIDLSRLAMFGYEFETDTYAELRHRRIFDITDDIIVHILSSNIGECKFSVDFVAKKFLELDIASNINNYN